LLAHGFECYSLNGRKLIEIELDFGLLYERIDRIFAQLSGLVDHRRLLIAEDFLQGI